MLAYGYLCPPLVPLVLSPSQPHFFLLMVIQNSLSPGLTWVCGHLWGMNIPKGPLSLAATVLWAFTRYHTPPLPLHTPEASAVHSCSVKGRSLEDLRHPSGMWMTIYSDKRGCWELMHTVPVSHRADALLDCLHCISFIHKTNFTKSIIRKRNKELIPST